MHTQEYISNVVIGAFEKHPLLGAITSLALALIGNIMPALIEYHIPLIYMQLMQILVWGIGATAGLLTIKGILQKKNIKTDGENK